jgi:hypothetical protein
LAKSCCLAAFAVFKTGWPSRELVGRSVEACKLAAGDMGYKAAEGSSEARRT